MTTSTVSANDWMISPIESWSACGATTIAAFGTSGELLSHTFTCKTRKVISASPYLSARFLVAICEELAGMLLDQVRVDDSDSVALQCKVDGEVPDKG